MWAKPSRSETQRNRPLVLEEARCGRGVHPGRRALGEDGAGDSETAGRALGNGQGSKLQLVLLAVELLEGEGCRVLRPREVGHDVEVVRGEGDEAFGAGAAALIETHDAQPDDGIRIAGLRIALGGEGVLDGEEVDDRKGRDPGLVELEIGDLPGVGRPGEGSARAGRELLFVDPIEPAVQDRVRSAPREPGFPTGRHVHHVEVVLPHEGDPAAVRRHRGELLFLGCPDQRAGALLADVHQEEVAAVSHQQSFPEGDQEYPRRGRGRLAWSRRRL